MIDLFFSLLTMGPLLAFCALGLEALLGYPSFLYKYLSHPVVWMGRLIHLTDQYVNLSHRTPEYLRILGGVTVFLLAIIVFGVSIALQIILSKFYGGFILLVVTASTLCASNSLYIHVLSVARCLQRNSLEEGRRAVSLIVGRDVEALDTHGVARAAVESLAENFSDGVVAPLFWCAIAGLPGMALYKLFNTADSMIGHKTERYKFFGFVAARVDDLVNFFPSRLSAVVLAISADSKNKKKAILTAFRDASAHESPNAGWPEASMAGALNLRLGGARFYRGMLIKGAFMGNGSFEISSIEIISALKLYKRARIYLGILLAVIIFVQSIFFSIIYQ